MNKKITIALLSVCLMSSLHMKAVEFVYNDLYGGPGAGTELPDFSRWHYFSFDETQGVVLKGTSEFSLALGGGGIGTETINTEWQARTDWDFAFHAYDLRTNSGIAGNGNAGAIFIADATATTPLADLYASLTEAPNVAYPADAVASGMFYLSLATMPPPRATSLSVSAATRKALEGATGASADFYSIGMGSPSAVNPMIIILKTASGKYVKIHLKEFANEEGKPGFLKFDYDFIPLEGTAGPTDEFTYNDLYGGPGAGTELPDFSRWHYFSFDETQGVVLKGTSEFTLALGGGGIGTETINTEWQARTDWDFAFHAYDLRTNSGLAGNGNAGAIFIADATANTPLADLYASLTEAPNVAYPADAIASGMFYLSLSSMPPPRATSLSVSAATRKALEGATGASADFYSIGMGSPSAVNPMIIILKTTSGKYVKVYLKDFVEEGKPGFLKLQYAFIPLENKVGTASIGPESAAVYPNPVSDVLNINLPEAASVTIYNIAGSPVKQLRAPSGLTTLPVTGWAKGTYIVKITSNTDSYTQKIVIK